MMMDRLIAGMGVDFADYNNDGWPDMVVDDLANQRYALYQNNERRHFQLRLPHQRHGAMTLLHSGWGVRFLDFDNDGWKDLLFAQGHDLDTIEQTSTRNYTIGSLCSWRAIGHGKFVDVSRVPPATCSTRPGWAVDWPSAISTMMDASMPWSPPTVDPPMSSITRPRRRTTG